MVGIEKKPVRNFYEQWVEVTSPNRTGGALWTMVSAFLTTLSGTTGGIHSDTFNDPRCQEKMPWLTILVGSEILSTSVFTIFAWCYVISTHDKGLARRTHYCRTRPKTRMALRTVRLEDTTWPLGNFPGNALSQLPGQVSQYVNDRIVIQTCRTMPVGIAPGTFGPRCTPHARAVLTPRGPIAPAYVGVSTEFPLSTSRNHE